MVVTKNKSSKQDKQRDDEKPQSNQPVRETVESIVVAIILALLFRAFVAEAFVIPTGSMAPTLMGTHKDVECPHCGINYRAGASSELPDRMQRRFVVGTICPNCCAENPLDLAGDRNHATFSGDRILVSKFSYALGKPSRFDVGVFKNPGNAKQNYIKRIVGLPNETVRIANGNLYVRPNEETEFAIARKPNLRKIRAMSHLVHDSDYQPKELLEAKYPQRWQPWDVGASSPPKDSWSSRVSSDGLTVNLEAGQSETRWLRYFHNCASMDEWNKAANNMSLASVSSYRGQAVTDSYAYNGYMTVWPQVILNERGGLKSTYRSGGPLSKFGRDLQPNSNSRFGGHWVGDLLLDVDVETEEGQGTLSLMLVRAGVRYRCNFDLSTGKATLSIMDGETQHSFDGGQTPAADTPVRSGQSHSIVFANYDDQIRLWVDGREPLFDGATTYTSASFRTQADDRPHHTAEDPLDAAPAAVGVSGVAATIDHLRVSRDKYYIADTGNRMTDYGPNSEDLNRVFIDPESWDSSPLWGSRRQIQFDLDADQYFPMGDNSPESADARGWTGRNFVPRDLLVGKAVFVFWPHPWYAPIPYTPNFARMKLIR